MRDKRWKRKVRHGYRTRNEIARPNEQKATKVDDKSVFEVFDSLIGGVDKRVIQNKKYDNVK